MGRTLLAVVGGLAVGLAVASAWRGGNDRFGTPVEVSSSSAQERFADLERALADERRRRVALERRVEELDEAVAALTGAELAAPDAAGPRAAVRPEPQERGGAFGGEPPDGPPPGARPSARGRFAGPEQRIERLVNGGFSRQRAEWLEERAEALRMQSLQAVYDARREGRELDGRELEGAANAQSLLREEIGEAEYEQYLAALGAPTAVGIRGVLTSSPAETAGLQSGDQVLSYAGTRVFDMRDLNRLTFEGESGEPVILEVLRNGQRMQVMIPRGPLGITGGGPFRQ